ncbi:hypothetical protein MMC12_000874 [Toensbergia leucococca]|nr:hypothetical protein [Toensbergia leucococca]
MGLANSDTVNSPGSLEDGTTIILRAHPPDSQVYSSNQLTFWASAAKPHSASPAFALGSSWGMAVLNSNGRFLGDIIQSGFNTHDYDSIGDILTVDWLDENVVLGGARNGNVWLWDSRHKGKSQRLRHPSGVCHVRKMDGAKVVVAGLQNKLQTYDLRFSPGPSITDATPTPPYLTFPAYTNIAHATPSLGFDVSPTHNILAAATDDQRVQLFDGATGTEMRIGGQQNVGEEGLLSGNVEGLARCLRFVDASRSRRREGLGLLVGIGGRVEEWAW